MPGASLWAAPDAFTAPAAACKGQTLGAEKPSAACKAFLDASEKAAAQWELERRFRAFESISDFQSVCNIRSNNPGPAIMTFTAPLRGATFYWLAFPKVALRFHPATPASTDRVPGIPALDYSRPLPPGRAGLLQREGCGLRITILTLDNI